MLQNRQFAREWAKICAKSVQTQAIKSFLVLFFKKEHPKTKLTTNGSTMKIQPNEKRKDEPQDEGYSY
jgi:hypothetical protein